jgi:histone-lysine N-methyltransferase SETMAR
MAKLWELSFGTEGCILVDILEKRETINAAHYVQRLSKLCHALHEKRPKKKTVILQHDKMGAYTACLTLKTIQKNSWELLSHPPYSPDLAPSDYYLFGPLKEHLRGCHYENDEAVQKALRSWSQGENRLLLQGHL